MSTHRACRHVVARLCLWLALAAASGPAAHADWAFTRWGMTPEQVVAASGGTAHLVPPGKRHRDEPDHWEIAAEGTSREGSVPLQTGYMFDTQGRGLICVLANATGDDAARLRDALLARYGQPREDSSFGPMRTLAWTKPDAVELTLNENPPTAAVTYCAPGR
jgi:hypothetical protein